MKFMAGGPNGMIGKLNIAAFLAQAMQETIRYDVCDENNWDFYNGVYPASNSCGQLGRNYQDYTCPVGSPYQGMECPLNSSMRCSASTNAKWYGAPPPLFGAPQNITGQYTPGWSYNVSCGTKCNVYPGQQAGAWIYGIYRNRAGRTDTENCVWWGRGVIQLTGRCEFGTLNHYLGSQAGAQAIYPDVNLCQDPSQICASIKYPELKWISGLFYWLQSVQTYNDSSWDFQTEITKLAADPTNQAFRSAFINAISGIVNKGSASAIANAQATRANNFEITFSIFAT